MFQKYIDLSLNIHIIFGFIAVVSFWIILIKKKGTSAHKIFGQVYYKSMIVLSVSSIINCMYYITREINLGLIHKGGRYWYLILFIATLIAMTPLYTAMYFEKADLKNVFSRNFILFINVIVLLFGIIISLIYIKLFPLIAILGLVILPVTLAPTIMFLIKNSEYNRIYWHIKLMLQSGIALHVGFLGGGFSSRYLSNNYTHITVPAISLLLIIIMVYLEKYFMKKYNNKVNINYNETKYHSDIS